MLDWWCQTSKYRIRSKHGKAALEIPWAAHLRRVCCKFTIFTSLPFRSMPQAMSSRQKHGTQALSGFVRLCYSMLIHFVIFFHRPAPRDQDEVAPRSARGSTASGFALIDVAGSEILFNHCAPPRRTSDANGNDTQAPSMIIARWSDIRSTASRLFHRNSQEEQLAPIVHFIHVYTILWQWSKGDRFRRVGSAPQTIAEICSQCCHMLPYPVWNLSLSNFKQLTFQEQHAVAPAWPELVMLVEVEGKDGKGDWNDCNWN